jgi:hypothetical protein
MLIEARWPFSKRPGVIISLALRNAHKAGFKFAAIAVQDKIFVTASPDLSIKQKSFFLLMWTGFSYSPPSMGGVGGG